MGMLGRMTRIFTGAPQRHFDACQDLCKSDGKIDPWRLAALLG